MRFFLLPFALFSIQLLVGQAGLPDTTFNQWRVQNFGNGFENSSTFFGSVESVTTVKAQANGKILVGGNFTTYNGENAARIIRLNSNGSWDKSFQAQIQDNAVSNFDCLAGGSILVSGSFTQVNGASFRGMALLDSTGQIIPGFATGSGFMDSNSSGAEVKSTIIQTDQKIVAAGSFNQYNGITCGGIIRLLPNGSVDPGFNTAGVDGYIYKILLQPDGKLIIGGNFTTCQGNTAVGICRLTASGDFDPTFQPGTSVSSSSFIFDLALQSSGKVIACGNFSQYNGQGFGGVMRLNTDGSIDNSFTGSSVTFPFYRRCLKLLPDDSFYIGGNFSAYTPANPSRFLAKVSPDGVFDPGFAVGTSFDDDQNSINQILSIEVLANGKVICGGQFNEYTGVLLKDLVCLYPNADLDYDFLPFTGCNGEVKCTAIDQNNRILVGGIFSMYDNKVTGKFIRLNEDGTLDSSFNTGTGPDDEVKSIAVQYDGKIIIAGKFKHFNGVSRNSIVRLNDDGSVDQTYNPGSSFITVNNTPSWVNSIKLQADGSLVAAGKFAYVNNNSSLFRQVIRFGEYGQLDNAFTPPFTEFGEMDQLEIQSSGKIVLASSSSFGISILNQNGLLDTLFMSSYPTASLGLDSEDNIYSSSIVDQYDLGQLKKYTPHGVLIATSNYGAKTMAFLPNGKIQIGVSRLNPDLSMDNSFNGQTIINNQSSSNTRINSISLQQHGQIIFGGNFSQYGDVFANNICRVLNDVSYIPFIKLTFQSVSDITCSSLGQAKAIGYSGTPPYSYLWNTTPVITDSVATFSQPGIYSCTVSDVFGDTKTASILIGGNPQNGFDLRASSIANEFRPGFNTQYVLDAFNEGCIPVSGQLKLTFDNSLLSFVHSDPSPSVITGNTLTWNFQNWTSDSAHFTPDITFLTSTNAQIGDTVDFTTEITPAQNDFDSSNNHMAYQFPIVNGFDPNDKSVYPKGKCDEGYILPNQKLTYQIRFQNTGNSEAINIRVTDKLNLNLDIRTVKIVAKSHECWTEVSDDNTLTFHFDQIHLIDSNANEPLSHGYIVFEVAANQSLPLPNGTQIENHAEIYFDFNPAVITNTVSNRIYNNSSISLSDYLCDPEEISSVETTSIYPNPASGNLTVLFIPGSTPTSLELIDNQGRPVISYSTIESKKLVLDLVHFASGTYLLRIKYPDKTEIIRVLKTM